MKQIPSTFTVKQVAQMFRKTTQRVYRLIQHSTLKAMSITSAKGYKTSTMISQKELLRYMKKENPDMSEEEIQDMLNGMFLDINKV